MNFATVIAAIALFVSLGGTVYAAAKIDGKNIRKGSIPGNRVQEQALTGALINESSLAPVPSAAVANEAARADSANRADRADMAARAKKASRATTAKAADSVPFADRVEQADSAGQAPNAARLGEANFESDDFVQRCKPGSVRAAIEVDPRPATPARVGFNCVSRDDIVVRRIRGGEYEISLPGIGDAAATASAFGRSSAASIAGTGPNLSGPNFVVKVYSIANGALLPAERFLVAVF
ncbi:MAG TPA: hypothetical protein VMS60_05030 [Solirubrobacterales bacterium]|nr:hypothetical protein [Solirubrobacterales bacterium]